MEETLKRGQQLPESVPYLVTACIQHHHLWGHTIAGLVILERHVGLCELDAEVGGQGITDAVPSRQAERLSHPRSTHPLKRSHRKPVRDTSNPGTEMGRFREVGW